MEHLIPYILLVNMAFAGGAFGWVVRVERRLAQIETTCKIKGGCNEGSTEGA